MLFGLLCQECACMSFSSHCRAIGPFGAMHKTYSHYTKVILTVFKLNCAVVEVVVADVFHDAHHLGVWVN